MQVNTEVENTRKKRRFAPKIRALALLVFALCWAVVLCLGLLFAILQDRSLPLPQKLQMQLADQINAKIAPREMRFEAAEFALVDAIHPKVTLLGVTVHPLEGARSLDVARVEVALDFWQVVGGQIQPRSMALSGAIVHLDRLETGDYDFGFGPISSGGPSPEIASLDTVIEQGETIARDPQLDWLRDLRIDDLTVNYTDRINHKVWTFDGGRFVATHRDQHIKMRLDLALLTGGEDPATFAISYDRQDGQPGVLTADVQNVATVDLATQSPALAWLQLVDGKLNGTLRTTQSTSGEDVLRASLNLGAGEINPGPGSRPIEYSDAKVYFSYTPSLARLDMDYLELQTDSGSASGQGYAILDMGSESAPNPNGMIIHVTGQATGVNPQNLLETPLDVQSGQAAAKLTFSPFSLDIGQMDMEVGPSRFSGAGQIRLQDGRWLTDVQVHGTDIAVAAIGAHWPHPVNPKAREWFETNITNGQITSASLSLKQPDDGPRQLVADFQFSDADVRFLKDFAPITAGTGYGRLANNDFFVTVQDGTVQSPVGGGLDIAGSTMTIVDITTPGPTAHFDLRGSGTVTAALSVLDQKPLELMTKANRPVTLADGAAEIAATLTTRLRKGNKPEDLVFDVNATVRDFRSAELVEGKVLNGRELVLSATPDRIQAVGDVRVGNVPATVTWTLPLGRPGTPATVLAQIPLGPEALDEFNIQLPPGSVSGTARGDLSLTLAAGKPAEFSVTSSLVGARVAIPGVGWVKPRGQAAKFSISGALTQPVTVRDIRLEGPGLSLSGALTLREGGGLKTATFRNLVAGSWLRSDVTLTGRGRNRPVDVALNGGRLDLRSAPFGGGQADGMGNLTARLDRFVIGDGLTLTNVRSEFLAGRGLNGQFNGRVNGGTPVQGFVKQISNDLVIELTSQNAGGALRDAGLLKQADDGVLALTLRGNNGTWVGDLSVKDARVKDAPAIAAVLSAVSVVGILEQLDGKGLLFNEIVAKFQLKDDLFTLYSSSAIGPSLGLSVDGFINTKTNQMDLQGVLSPFYFINAIGAIFTRRGEGLIGFNFNLRGSTSDPKVAVNPLSALTPGLFREIFRRPPPKLE